jgi:hypothetical protein
MAIDTLATVPSTDEWLTIVIVGKPTEIPSVTPSMKAALEK